MNKILIDKIYSAESIVDVEEDIDFALKSRMCGLPVDEHGFHKGDFKLTLEFISHEQ